MGSQNKASVLCRKRYADDKVVECLGAGIRQFVFLGAGLDTRPYRLVTPTGARAFEIDLAANITYKRERLRIAFGGAPENVALTALDFEHENLNTALAAAGFDRRHPAMFVWEAVTQYLTEDAVRRTLAFLRDSASGSHLIFTFLRQDYLDGVKDFDAAQARRDFVAKHQLWRFGLDPHNVGTLVNEYGWAELEQVGGAEYLARYIAPTGRHMPVSEIERFVHATSRPTASADN